MIIKRSANERGKMKWSWLEANYTFSFANYFDPKWMGFSKLRVINDDYIDGGMGFETHPHRNMEIVSFIIEGGLEHKDTMGNHSVIEPGEIQVMSAGTGVYHSEYNPFPDKKTHSIQIWIEPKVLDVKPSYQQYKFPDQINELTLLVSPDKEKRVATINQDAEILLGRYENSKETIELDQNSKYWIHIYAGNVLINGEQYAAGDGIGIQEEKNILLDVSSNAQFLLFKLP